LTLSKTFAEQLSAEPEFFIDRCLGHRTATELAAVGWRVHRIADHFPDDGQKTTDPEWIDHFILNQAAIHTAAAEPGPALYKIYPERIAKIWP
jgi:hypothetical protein